MARAQSAAGMLLVIGLLWQSVAAAQSLPPLSPNSAQVLRPALLSNAAPLFNPLSGLYAIVQQNPPDLSFQPANPLYTDAAPLSGSPVNAYGRLSWHSLEPSKGVYDYAIIDDVLERCPAPTGRKLCLPPGVTFGFRIMALNPQVRSDTNVTIGSDGYKVYSDLPVYLENSKHGWLLPVDPKDATQGHYFIPDWNDPQLLDRMRALLSALGRRYDGDPQIGWIDIGLYGSWGEWHTGGLPDAADYTRGIPYVSAAPYFSLNAAAYLANTGTPGAYQPGTIATKDAIVDAYARAFPKTQLLMLTDDGDGLCHALTLPGSPAHIGMRRDSLGSGSNSWTYQFPDQLPDCNSMADQSLIANRWKSAPFIAEPYGNGSSPQFPCQTFETDPATGQFNLNEQVTEFHLAAIKNGSFCSGPWSALSVAEQQAVLTAGLQAGYRLAPVEIDVAPAAVPSYSRRLSIRTHWANAGVTPTYHDWSVEFSLWTTGKSGAPQHAVASFVSRVHLRKILPTGNAPAIIDDSFDLGIPPPGLYELRLRVIDPSGYLNPMQLALQNGAADGYYELGVITLPAFGASPG
jgi:hypothetical protein